MLKKFIHHVRENKVLDVNGYYMLAISGGIDSVVLAHLLKRAGVRFGMAHCNFQLRGEESEGDEAFVRQLGEDMGVKVHVRKFDTESYREMMGGSLQMAARELRYRWFSELMEKGMADGVIIAHHADDQLETVMLNLLRGTGIEGIYGMAEMRERFIRPLLPFSRDEIMAYLKSEGLGWREDSSNEKDEYKRNFLRHRVMPLLNEFDPQANDILRNSFGRIKDTGKAFFSLFQNWKKEHVKEEKGFEYLYYSDIQGLSGQTSLLYYWLKPKGFGYAQVEDVLCAVTAGDSGKFFIAGKYMLNLDRDRFILGPKEEEVEDICLESHDIEMVLGESKYELITLQQPQKIDISVHNAMIDKALLDYPLVVRNWREGDKFRPLGMRNFKKLSDFLIDLKVPLIEKKRVKVLCSGKNVVWIIGYRLDDRYKISAATHTVLYIKKC